eukprot:TRINITY_DN5887_c0_g1_i1.p1 TRINITY_DN5887_c0_g1~~TRINITY_DN5887_c0_g1_i1.p1  ORF type:complete len:575 (-),score=134.22 TRINITY_DN5887_c0_g1_i1:663-2351(-)
MSSSSSIKSGSFIGGVDSYLPEKRKAHFLQLLKLNRIKDARLIALGLNSSECWSALATAALSNLELSTAIEAYRNLGDAGMVLSLQSAQYAEDTNLLAGHAHSLLGNYNEAQKLFLSSPIPSIALRMRRDLLHWESALQLAKQLAPEEIPKISTEYAQQLEFKGDYSGALSHYQVGLQGSSDGMELYARAQAGTARCNIRTGDIAKGVDLALKSRSTALQRECAMILENMKMYIEAAQLFATSALYDKAAGIYIQMRNYMSAKDIMAYVSSPALHSQYAKAKEEEGDFFEAEKSYLLANDIESVIRLNLKFKATPEKAFDLVRQTKNQSGAKMVAEYCVEIGDHRSAIEFLLLAKLEEDAFALAVERNAVERFAEVVSDKGTPEQYKKVAQYYEGRGEFLEAGRFYSMCQEYTKSVELFINASDSSEKAILAAIEVVGKAKNDALTHKMLDFLMGDTDGLPKDPNFIFRLYMALGNYLQAARTAIIIARQEQDMGNYSMAHTILFDTHNILTTKGIKVIPELKRNLNLVHSYILAKVTIYFYLPFLMQNKDFDQRQKARAWC